MKSTISTRLLSLSSFLFFIINTYAQETEKINLSAGLGYPELINVGVRFQLEQSQLGLYIGTKASSEASGFSVGGDYYYHFGGSSDFSTRKPWFVKTGLNYLHEKDEYDDNKYVLLVPRIRRDFNLSSKVGIALEAGIIVVLYRKETELKPDDINDLIGLLYGFYDVLPPIFPSLGVTLFYRL